MKKLLEAYLRINVIDIEDGRGNYLIRLEGPKDWMEGWMLKKTSNEYQALTGKLKVLASSSFISLKASPLANLSIDYRKITIIDEDGLKDFLGKAKQVSENAYKKQKPWAELVSDNSSQNSGYNR